MKFINLCLHEVNVIGADGAEVMTLPGAKADAARVDAIIGAVTEAVAGVEIHAPTTFGEVIGLPDAQPGVMFVVSGMTLDALRGTRPDVLAPGELARAPEGGYTRRDGTTVTKGQPIGCHGLRRG